MRYIYIARILINEVTQNCTVCTNEWALIQLNIFAIILAMLALITTSFHTFATKKVEECSHQFRCYRLCTCDDLVSAIWIVMKFMFSNLVFAYTLRLYWITDAWYDEDIHALIRAPWAYLGAKNVSNRSHRQNETHVLCMGSAFFCWNLNGGLYVPQKCLYPPVRLYGVIT